MKAISKNKILLLLTLFLVFALPGTALAKGSYGDQVVFGGSFTLRNGETVNGNLVVFGGNATLEEGSTVTRDVAVFGGNLEASGQINRSVIGFGGNITLTDTAVVKGDVNIVGGNLNRATGATIGGGVNSGSGGYGPFGFDFHGIQPPSFYWQNSPFSIMANIMWFFLRVFLWAALAVLAVMFLPAYVGRVANTATSQPVLSGGIGLLTAVVLPIVLVLIMITIILIPVSLIGFLLLAVAWAFGLIALGSELGRRMAHSLNQTWAAPVAAGIGTFVLILVINGVRDVIPCVGWILSAIVGMIGLGAVILSRFGTTSYPTYPYRPASGLATPPPPPAGDWPPAPPAPPSGTVYPPEQDYGTQPDRPENPPEQPA